MFDVENYNITHITDYNDILHLPRWFLWSFPLFNTIMIVLGLAGNLFVLVATLKYDAIDLDRASVMYLQNLAGADSLILVFYFIPVLLVLISRKWILGEFMCFIAVNVTSYAFFVENLMILAIACHRAWVVLKPFKPPSIRLSYLVINMTWAMGLVHEIVLMFWSSKVYYSPYIFNCRRSFGKSLIAFVIVRQVVPSVVIISANMIILGVIFSLKPIPGITTASRRKPLLLVFWTSFVYLLIWIPDLFESIIGARGHIWDTKYFNPEIMEICTLYLHLVLNPVIYTLTNKRFKSFVLSK